MGWLGANKQRNPGFGRNIGRRLLFPPILANGGNGEANDPDGSRHICGRLEKRAFDEIQARELMERQSERLDEYPEVKAKVAAHLQETNQQLKRLEQCPGGVR